MVSHIEPPNQQLIPRRPPSVTSRASTSRRHRSSRSHHGTASSVSQNEFPIFSHTGEVEIIITPINGRNERRYLLHRLILSQSSGFFDIDTARDPFGAQPVIQLRHTSPGLPFAALHNPLETDSSRTSVDSTTPRRLSSQFGSSHSDGRRWRYVLDWGNTPDGQAPMLVQTDASTLMSTPESYEPPPVSRNKPPASSSSFFRSLSNFSALNLNGQPSTPLGPDDDLIRDYDNLFRIFYNYAPTLDEINIANAYTESKALLQLADMYDALDVVGPRIDHHLLRFQGRLFKQIAKYPPSYLKLAHLAKSKAIFAEALIHVVGQWPLGAPQLRTQVDPAIMDLIEDKVDELEEVKAKVEAKLFRLTLTTSRGERVTPGNSYLDWLAMSLFRQWIAENTTPPPVSILKDSSRPDTGNSTPPANSRALPPARSTHSSSRSGHSRDNNQALVPTRHRSHAPPPPPYTPSPLPPSPVQIYHILGSSTPSAYLPHHETKRFLKLSPELYTRTNLRRFEQRLDELKNLARDAVRPLTRNCLELEVGGTGMGYLTCTRIVEEDFPWDD